MGLLGLEGILLVGEDRGVEWAYACEMVLAAFWLNGLAYGEPAYFFRRLFGPFGRCFCITHGERSCRESFRVVFAGAVEGLER
jgi:hypothetical protein